MVEHEVAHAQKSELLQAAAAVGESRVSDAEQAVVVVPLQRVLAS